MFSPALQLAYKRAKPLLLLPCTTLLNASSLPAFAGQPIPTPPHTAQPLGSLNESDSVQWIDDKTPNDSLFFCFNGVYHIRKNRFVPVPNIVSERPDLTQRRSASAPFIVGEHLYRYEGGRGVLVREMEARHPYSIEEIQGIRFLLTQKGLFRIEEQRIIPVVGISREQVRLERVKNALWILPERGAYLYKNGSAVLLKGLKGKSIQKIVPFKEMLLLDTLTGWYRYQEGHATAIRGSKLSSEYFSGGFSNTFDGKYWFNTGTQIYTYDGKRFAPVQGLSTTKEVRLKETPGHLWAITERPNDWLYHYENGHFVPFQPFKGSTTEVSEAGGNTLLSTSKPVRLYLLTPKQQNPRLLLNTKLTTPPLNTTPWVATPKGVFRMVGDRLEQIRGLPSGRYYFLENYPLASKQDLLITNRGIYLYKEGQATPLPGIEGEFFERRDDAEKGYVATKNGCYLATKRRIYLLKEGKATPVAGITPSATPLHLYETEGVAWVTSAGCSFFLNDGKAIPIQGIHDSIDWLHRTPLGRWFACTKTNLYLLR